MAKIEIGSQEWLDKRRTLITATDLPIIMGKSPWCTPLQLYHKKKSGTESVKTESMQRGIDLEDKARRKFEELTGHFVYPEFRISEKYPWMAASFDGINENGVVVEIKCPGEKDHALALEGKIPEYYIWQMVHQMAVADAKSVYYVSYRPQSSDPTIILKLHRDPIMHLSAVSESRVFWDDMNLGIPPEPNRRDAKEEERIKIMDHSFLEKERQLLFLMQEAASIEEQIGVLRQQLIEQCKGKSSEGEFLTFTRSLCKGHIEYNKIEELKSVDLEKFRKPSFEKWTVKEKNK